ncbi:MAG: hypothetical protein AB201_02550 [Parcubacteria bacterium C7867-006]|nr:MAG: hypothetical protein AB201_02550 [Parcubacteria bacterium C7867-006]
MENEPINSIDVSLPKPETSTEQQAVMEAIERLYAIEDPNNLLAYTAGKTGEEISQYLEENREKFIPEEIFFLETTIGLRKQQGK